MSSNQAQNCTNSPATSPIRLLLVEDSPADARLLLELLETDYPRQYTAEVVPSIAAAKEVLSTQNFHAVMLDLSLPDSHGIETIERLSRIDPSLPIIVMTGLDDADVAAQAISRGAQDYLQKGCTSAAAVAR
ncbi:MAG: response regulator, partial [Planctomycetaceae bacterium]